MNVKHNLVTVYRNCLKEEVKGYFVDIEWLENFIINKNIAKQITRYKGYGCSFCFVEEKDYNMLRMER